MSEDKERPSLRQSRPSSTSSSNSEWELIPEFPSPLEEHKHLIPPTPAVSNIATVTTYSMSNHMHTILTVLYLLLVLIARKKGVARIILHVIHYRNTRKY